MLPLNEAVFASRLDLGCHKAEPEYRTLIREYNPREQDFRTEELNKEVGKGNMRICYLHNRQLPVCIFMPLSEPPTQ